MRYTLPEYGMDRLESMSVLVAAVETGSLSAASRRLGRPLATVSRKVSELEAHLGTRLLTRSNRRLTLTDAGQAYFAACKRILDDLQEAERVAAGEYTSPRGELTVTAPVVFGRLHVLPVVAEFLRAYREIDIRMVLSDRMVNLIEDHIDVAVRIGDLPDSSLIAMRVGAIRRVVCASPGYFAARGTPQDPAELSAHDCITFEGVATADDWTFGAGRSAASIPVHSRLVVNTAEAAIDAAIAGIGVTRVLSYQAASALRKGTLAVALREYEPAPAPINLVYGSAPMLTRKLRAFLDFTVPRLRARFAENGG